MMETYEENCGITEPVFKAGFIFSKPEIQCTPLDPCMRVTPRYVTSLVSLIVKQYDLLIFNPSMKLIFNSFNSLNAILFPPKNRRNVASLH